MENTSISIEFLAPPRASSMCSRGSDPPMRCDIRCVASSGIHDPGGWSGKAQAGVGQEGGEDSPSRKIYCPLNLRKLPRGRIIIRVSISLTQEAGFWT